MEKIKIASMADIERLENIPFDERLSAKNTYNLIQQGAKLVSQVNDILEEIQLPLMVQPSLTRQNKKSHLVLDSAHQKLLKCIGYEATSVNVLVKRSELTVEKVTAMLIALEINGHIQSTLRGYLKI